MSSVLKKASSVKELVLPETVVVWNDSLQTFIVAGGLYAMAYNQLTHAYGLLDLNFFLESRNYGWRGMRLDEGV